MVAQPHVMTAEQFDEFLHRPENADRDFEFIAGEIIEVPSNTQSSEIAITIAAYFKMYLIQNQIDGHVTGEAGLYRIGDERYAQDVAFKRTPTTTEHVDPNPPELVIEVVSPSDDPRLLSIKISNYLAVGTTVWVAYPADQRVVTHVPGKGATILSADDTLTYAGLPGFELPVKNIF
ncbi:MAG: Uma2 family endonuclease [Anaerolineae bacterium]|nr:Uma2 family endonuclease [Anaerolineae bacterium]